jgi:hypothetical protein
MFLNLQELLKIEKKKKKKKKERKKERKKRTYAMKSGHFVPL